MCKFELFTPRPETSINTAPAKIDEPSKHQFKNCVNFNGQDYILLTEVQEAISQATIATTPVTIIPTIVKDVAIVKHTTGDIINISLQLKDIDAFTIYDLYDFLSLDDSVGLAFNI